MQALSFRPLALALGMMAAVSVAEAGPISIVAGPAGGPFAGTIPSVGGNEMLPLFTPLGVMGLGNGFFGSTITGVTGIYQVDFYGAEAGFRNQFAAPGTGVLFTTSGNMGSALNGVDRATSLAAPLASVNLTLSAGVGGALDFRFLINSALGSPVINGSNPNDLGIGSGPNFFATFDPRVALASQALTGNSVYLFLDDGSMVDDNHDDMLVRITYVPEPASLAILGMGLLGLGMAARRRRA